jgi:flagellar biosynthesis protein FlhG
MAGDLAVSHASDQSAGLRRLLSRNFVRSVTLVGGKGGIGRTAVLTNVAAALARQGRSVLLLDQNQGRAAASARLGLSQGRDLLDVMERDVALDEILQHGPDGLRILAGAQAYQVLGSLSPAEEEKLGRAFECLTPKLDYILVDAPAGDAIQTPSLSLASQEVIVMVSPHTESVTRAYSLIQRLSWDFARRRFYILANGVRSSEQGSILFDNIARTARLFLNLSLEYLGCVPDDDAMRKACRLRRPVTTLFPESPAAIACAMLADAIDQWPYPGEDCLDEFVQRLLQSQRFPVLS